MGVQHLIFLFLHDPHDGFLDVLLNHSSGLSRLHNTYMCDIQLCDLFPGASLGFLSEG